MNKFIDLMKEVFWLKKSTAKKQLRRAPAKTRKPAPKPALPAGRPAKVKPKKPAKPAKVPKTKAPAVDPNLVQAGKITQGSILIGDRLTIKGPKTSFVQKVWSMQIENKDVKVARKGEWIGLKVEKPVAVGDIVYK